MLQKVGLCVVYAVHFESFTGMSSIGKTTWYTHPIASHTNRPISLSTPDWGGNKEELDCHRMT